jgi:hypothetical protein
LIKSISHYAYAQARLQARHGQRPGEHVWLQLHGTGDLANYLLVVRRTSLRHWVLGMNVSHSIHEIEQSLRDQLRGYIDEIADWLPTDWRESVRWISRLPDLPALQHLLAGNAAQSWMLSDPMLRDFASEERELRLDAIMRSDCYRLAESWQKGHSLPDAWLDHWQQLLPENSLKEDGIRQMIRLYHEHLSPPSDTEIVDTAQQRLHLETRLTSLFRHYSFQATAAFAHLGLVALDLGRLRSGLVRRALFPEAMKEAS